MMSDRNNGLLNDVLIVGNELSGKLNEIGISNTFGRASEGKDDLISLIRMAIDGIDMVVDENSYVSLTATNPYLLTGETTDIVAKLRNGVCRPLTNKSVTIEQSVFIDNGTTVRHNDNWTLTSNMQRTRNDSYTTLSNVGGTSQMAYPINDTTKFSGDIAIEWDNWATDYQLNYFIVKGSTDMAKTFGALYINKPCKVRITIIGTTMKCYINGVDKATYDINRDANNQFQVRLQINPNGNDIKYSNFKVYQIINAVTDGKGEFALPDVSVTDDTTFTASYGTETATTDVYLCKMVDYGVTGKSRLNYWYWNSNYGSGSVDDNGTTFTSSSTSTYLTVSALTTEIYPNLNIYIYDFPFTVEFDIISFDDPSSSSPMSRMRIYNLTDKHLAYWDLKDYGIGHYKIVCTEGSQKLYFNGVEQSRKFTFTTTNGHWDCSFQTYGNIKLKNFRIR